MQFLAGGLLILIGALTCAGADIEWAWNWPDGFTESDQYIVGWVTLIGGFLLAMLSD